MFAATKMLHEIGHAVCSAPGGSGRGTRPRQLPLGRLLHVPVARALRRRLAVLARGQSLAPRAGRSRRHRSRSTHRRDRRSPLGRRGGGRARPTGSSNSCFCAASLRSPSTPIRWSGSTAITSSRISSAISNLQTRGFAALRNLALWPLGMGERPRAPVRSGLRFLLDRFLDLAMERLRRSDLGLPAAFRPILPSRSRW